MFLQDPGGVVGPLALSHGVEACPLGGQVQSTDAGKQGKVGQFHIKARLSVVAATRSTAEAAAGAVWE